MSIQHIKADPKAYTDFPGLYTSIQVEHTVHIKQKWFDLMELIRSKWVSQCLYSSKGNWVNLSLSVTIPTMLQYLKAKFYKKMF